MPTSVGTWYIVIVGLGTVTGLATAVRQRDASIGGLLKSLDPMARVQIYCFFSLAIGSTIAVLAPSVVMFGFFAGIAPGVFLWLSPTLLFYWMLWSILRATLWSPVRLALHLVDRGAQWGSLRTACDLAAAILILATAVAVPESVNDRNEGIVRVLRAEDREPATPPLLPDTIALDFPRNGEWKSTTCETICLRLLYNSVVKEVLVTKKGDLKPTAGWTRYRIERRQRCPSIYFGVLAVVFDTNWRDHPDHGDPRENAVEHVKARIAAGECLIEEEAVSPPPAPTLTLRGVKKGGSYDAAPWSLDPDALGAQRLELLDPQGQSLYRRTEVRWQRLDAPLRFWAWANPLAFTSYAGLSRTEEVDSPLGPAARDVLPVWFGKAMRKPARPASRA